MAATFTFGRFTPPIPFSASDQQKIDASITQTITIKLEDYPVGYEMVKARVDWTGSALDIDRVVEFRWYNEDTNELLFTWQGTFLAGWVWAWMESWIGHKDSGEIDRPGNYIVQIFSPGLFSKEIRFTVTAELPPEPEPEYPKTISRGPYSFTANNSNEETQIKEFLGIEPAGDDLDVWLSKKDTAGIQQWLNYWGNIWEDLGRGDLFSFTTAKAKEYFDKLEEEESGIFIELFKTNFAGALTLLPNLSQFVINTALESLIRNFESRVEDFADYLADRFLADYPEYSILRGEKKGSLTLLGIFMIVGSIIGFGTLVNWLRKELPEPAGMAVWASIEAEDWETANAANQKYRKFINVANTWIISTMGWLNPFIKSYFDKNRDSQLASADTYQKLIDSELAIKTGTLTINPTPADAKVSVSGQIPVTGVYSAEIEAGIYSATISKFGFKSESKALEVIADEETTWNPILSEEEVPPPLKAKLIISVEPSDADIEVANYPEINSPGEYEVDAGSYTIDFTKEGYESVRRTIYINQGEIKVVSVILKEIEPLPPPEELEGQLIISVIPSDAIIEVAGITEITIPGTYILNPGSYDIKASKEGFITQTKRAYVNEGKITAVAFILEEVEIPPEIPSKATMEIISDPSDADVYINGEFKWTTTPYTIVLDAGTYILRLQKEGYYPQEASVTLGEGDEVEVPFLLSEIPVSEIPPEPYIPQTYYYPTYEPATPYIPEISLTPYSQVPAYDYSTLYPEAKPYVPYEAPAPVLEKELLINIETTDVKPWEGRIYSIAFQDLSTPGAEPWVLINDNEEELIRGFLGIFDEIAPEKLIGFKLTFDHRFIFAKMMLYRIQNKSFKDIEMLDVKQIMDQVQEKFVYFPSKIGTLDNWGKMLLGKGKYGTQETMLKRYISGDFEYVKAFQLRQLELTKGLYDLTRFCGLESFSAPISALPPALSLGLAPGIEEIPSLPNVKKCPNCLAEQPIDAKVCDICGQQI